METHREISMQLLYLHLLELVYTRKVLGLSHVLYTKYHTYTTHLPYTHLTDVLQSSDNIALYCPQLLLLTSHAAIKRVHELYKVR